jgi:DNA invertase Pin-like site-specific DNA recombinase
VSIVESRVDGTAFVVEYLRVSTNAQDVQRQEDSVPRLADQLPDGLADLPRHRITDEGVSASKFSIDARPGGVELLRLIEQGRVAAIVCDHQDRLCRGRQSEWWLFSELCNDAGVRIFAVDGGEIRDDEGSEIMAAARASMARRESQKRSHRITSSFASSRERGYWIGRKLPFAFTAEGPRRERVLTPDPDTMPVVVEAYRRRAEGASKNALALYMTEATGEEWTRHRVRDLLRSGTYAGWVTHEVTPGGKIELTEGRHGPQFGVEPPVSREMWEAVQEMDERGPAYFQRRVQPYGNLLHCGECGSHLIYRNDRRAIKRGGNPHAYHRCENTECRKVSAITEKLDACTVLGFCILVRVIRDNIHRDDLPILQTDAEQVGALSLSIADLTRKIKNLHDLAEDADEDEFAELRPRVAALKEERSEKKRLHDTLCLDSEAKRQQIRALADTLEDLLGLAEVADNFVWAGFNWSQLDVDDRRRMLGDLLEGIDVFPNRLVLRFTSAGIAVPVPLATGRRGTADQNLRAVGFGSYSRHYPRQEGVATPW